MYLCLGAHDITDLLAVGIENLLAVGITNLLAVGITNLLAVGITNLLAVGITNLLAVGITNLLAVGITNLLAVGITNLLLAWPDEPCMQLAFTYICFGVVVGLTFTWIVVDQVKRLTLNTTDLSIHGQRITFEH